ncbi:hypothetical protein NDU88_012718, partial [Pleurodeles waltl]
KQTRYREKDKLQNIQELKLNFKVQSFQHRKEEKAFIPPTPSSQDRKDQLLCSDRSCSLLKESWKCAQQDKQ